MEAKIKTSERYLVTVFNDIWYIIATDLGKKFTFKFDNSDKKFQAGKSISREDAIALFAAGRIS